MGLKCVGGVQVAPRRVSADPRACHRAARIKPPHGVGAAHGLRGAVAPADVLLLMEPAGACAGAIAVPRTPRLCWRRRPREGWQRHTVLQVIAVSSLQRKWAEFKKADGSWKEAGQGLLFAGTTAWRTSASARLGAFSPTTSPPVRPASIAVSRGRISRRQVGRWGRGERPHSPKLSRQLID
jgi:hypothetical protein